MSALGEFLNELDKQVGDLRTDEYSRILYSTDASIYQVMPYGVLVPQSAEEIHAAVELSAKHRIPLLPRASGSSLAGQCVNEALVIDTTRHLHNVLEVNQEERWVRVQPGIVLDELNAYLKPYGLKFGPDPASSSRAAMGGIVSNNSTGAHSILYGMTADHVLAMKVILSDGTWTEFRPKSTHNLLQYHTQNSFEAHIYRQISALTYNDRNRATIQAGTPRHWRRCGGYNLDRFVNGEGVSFQWPHDPTFNLAKLVCGAEGTLAVITELKLNLVPLPQHSALAIVHFASLKEALDAVPIMLECEPSAIELLDNLGLTMCRNVPEYARLLQTFIDGEPNCVLITEFYGEDERDLRFRIDDLRKYLQRHGVRTTGMTTAFSAEKQSNVWKVRKVGLGLLMSIRGDHKPIPFIEDAAVPVEHLSDYVLRLEQFCHSIDTQVAYYAHASAGCLHVRPLINAKVASDVAKMPQILAFSLELLGEYGGSLSSEHGDGRARSCFNEAFFGKDLYQLYQQVKRTFDPHNLLNPGNVVDAQPMTEQLRYGADYSTIPLTEHLDFSADQGFHRAIEMCNGAGVCRKLSVDTMCPSFMATREEEHSTRGRANALRAVLSGTPLLASNGVPLDHFTSQRLYDVMDLCIGCKACKAECPSSVDMAKIKTEFLAHFHEANGIPLRAKLFANIATLSKWGSRFAPLANWMLQNRPIRIVLERWLGISRERELPRFSQQTYFDWFNSRSRLQRDNAQHSVVLLTDVYTTYNYPQIAIAATEVLEALGFQVIPSRQTDVGRPAISKGILELARRLARETVAELAPHAQQDIPIISLEPSDASAVRDDYLSLIPAEPHVRLVAESVVTFEEFVAPLVADGKWYKPNRGTVLLHGHCHQKALIGTQPSHQLLAGLGYTVDEVDSGCCGMAGSFGYEAEHLDISLAMAERRLLPAVRRQPDDVLIVAAGVSCRQQIKHGTGRTAHHSAELLHRVLMEQSNK